MSTSGADRTLLGGLLALQIGFIEREALVEAIHAWTVEKDRTLGEVLRGRGAISAEERDLLESVIDRHLARHGDDPARCLAILRDSGLSRIGLEAIDDPDLIRSLAHLSADVSTREDDSYATRAESDDVPTITAEAEAARFLASGRTSGFGSPACTRFQVVRFHARGGLGQVSVALDHELDRHVALKEIQDRHADHPVSRARFLLEAEITGKLEHPGIIPIYGRGQYADGRPYYAMRFIRGESLKEATDRFHADASLRGDPGRRELRLRELLERFLHACDAIGYAHSRGVLHRDIKPGNVMLGPFGETLVVDWGLAKPVGADDPTGPTEVHDGPVRVSGSVIGFDPTMDGSVIGSPPFMSPEQAAGAVEQLGPASDVFSLGATLYYLLTGRPPYQEDDFPKLMEKALIADFPPPRTVDASISRPLEAICLRTLAREPAKRYAASHDLAADLRRWLADEPVSAYREGLGSKAVRWARRNRTTCLLTGALLIASVVGLGLGLWQVGMARRQAVRSAEMAHARFSLALEAFHTLVFEVQDHLRDRPGLQPLRVDLLRTASDGIARLLDQAGSHDADSTEADLLMFSARVQAGDLATQLGRPGQAREQFDKARQIADRRSKANPADLRARRNLSVALNRLGDLALNGGDLETASLNYQRAEDLMKSVVADDRQSLQAWRDLWVARCKMGDIRKAQGDLAGAALDYRRALELATRLLGEKGTDRSKGRIDLANSLVKLGELAASQLDFKGAETSYDQALREITALLDSGPSDPRPARRFLSIILADQGELAMSRDDFPAAITAFDQDLAMTESLAREDPADVRLLRDLSIGYNKRGNARYLMADAAGACDDHRRALQRAEVILSIEPDSTAARRDVSIAANRLGDASLVIGELNSARTSFHRSLELRQSLVDRNPRNVQAQLDLTLTQSNLGELALEAFSPAQALTWFDRAVAILNRLEASGSLPKQGGHRAFRDYLKTRADFCRLSDPKRLDPALVAKFPVSFRPKLLAPWLVLTAHSERSTSIVREADFLADLAMAGDLESAKLGARTLALVVAQIPPGLARDHLTSRAVALLERVRALGGFATRSGLAWLRRADDLGSIRGLNNFRALRLDVEFPSNPFAH